MSNKEKAAEILNSALKLIPHKKFTFAKIWILAAQLEIRRKHMTGARALLGRALGICPKRKIFQRYVEMEFFSGNIERCRIICERFITFKPRSVETWTKYAELEATVEEYTRAKAIFELALEQPIMDIPELLWKSYIDFETARMNRQGVRDIYERLLKKTQHVKIWLGYANFEAKPLQTAIEKGEESYKSREHLARTIYNRGYNSLFAQLTEHKEEVVTILNAWVKFEKSCIAETETEKTQRVHSVLKKMPQVVNRKHLIYESSRKGTHVKESWDYIFPEEEKSLGLKLLEAAYKWKKEL